MNHLGKYGAIVAALAAFALGFIEPAAAQDKQAVALPAGKLAVHYYRPDGNYDGWGLHLWETFEKIVDGKPGPKEGSDRTVSPLSWMAPMKPTGKSDFGVYWQFDADEFTNGKANYIIHKGDAKDQCGRDMFWMIKDGKQIWVNAGDCNVYLSREDALKARK
jgi:hypothetical protein